jgi:hypothetical protein
MGHDPLSNALLILACLWLGTLVWWAWLKGRSAPVQTTFPFAKAVRTRAKDPKPFAGLTKSPSVARVSRPLGSAIHVMLELSSGCNGR